ncbi:MAG: 50S ribosomal protein L2 [Candidatus Nanoarchaeia archaeon]
MGKRIISQRRGKGTPAYKSPSHRYTAKPRHPVMSEGISGKVIDIVKCVAHSAPLVKIYYENKKIGYNIAPAGVRIGDSISSDKKTLNNGDTVALKDITEGTFVFNIESQPGDGGKFVRSSGGAAKVVGRQGDKVVVVMPSKRQKTFSALCRATIGVVAGSGRKEKPFVKAGNKHYKMKARNKLWPRTEGVRMNAVDHPYGNSRSSNKGHPTIARKHAPPGAKVGKIRPRRTGKKVGKASKKVR